MTNNRDNTVKQIFLQFRKLLNTYFQTSQVEAVSKPYGGLLKLKKSHAPGWDQQPSYEEQRLLASELNLTMVQNWNLDATEGGIVKIHAKFTPTKISCLSNLKIFLIYNGSGRGAAW